MAQISVDPERLREFSTKIDTFVIEILGCGQQISGELFALGETFQDIEYDELFQEFLRIQAGLNNFAAEIQKVCPLMRKDADTIEEFQKTKR